MRIPNGMTEQEVLDVIEKLSKKFASRFKFAYYEPDDIKQECFLIALDGLSRYDGSTPLINFLSVHMRNRLLSLKRDKFSRREKESTRYDKSKRYLAQPIDIDEVNHENEPSMWVDINLLDKMITAEQMAKIDRELEIEYRMNFLRLLSGKSLTKFQRDRVVNRIIEILA